MQSKIIELNLFHFELPGLHPSLNVCMGTVNKIGCYNDCRNFITVVLVLPSGS